MIKEIWEYNNKIFIFGNGGSAATASHFKNDLEKYGSQFAYKRLTINCLNDNIPLITAIANDENFENIFLNQLQSKVEENDLVIAISTSGRSRNVIKAVTYAKLHGAKIIGMTGNDGELLKTLSNLSLHTDIEDAGNIEDIHMIMCHTIASVIHDYFKILREKT